MGLFIFRSSHSTVGLFIFRSSHTTVGLFIFRSSHTTDELVVQELPCKPPGVIGSALRLAIPASVYCDWVMQTTWCYRVSVGTDYPGVRIL